MNNYTRDLTGEPNGRFATPEKMGGIGGAGALLCTAADANHALNQFVPSPFCTNETRHHRM